MGLSQGAPAGGREQGLWEQQQQEEGEGDGEGRQRPLQLPGLAGGSPLDAEVAARPAAPAVVVVGAALIEQVLGPPRYEGHDKSGGLAQRLLSPGL